MCHIQGSGFRIQGLGFRVWVLGFLRVIWGNSLSIQPKDPRKPPYVLGCTYFVKGQAKLVGCNWSFWWSVGVLVADHRPKALGREGHCA